MHICFYDFETSGFSEEKNEVIQIAAVIFEIDGKSWKKLDTFERKLIFDVERADEVALAKNCYEPEVWESEAVLSAKAIVDFDVFIKSYKDVQRHGRKPFKCLRVGGHNIDKFDERFMRAWYNKHDMFCAIDYQETYDTLALAKWYFRFLKPDLPKPENLQLSTLCEYFGIKLDNAHDAEADILANARLAWMLTR